MRRSKIRVIGNYLADDDNIETINNVKFESCYDNVDKIENVRENYHDEKITNDEKLLHVNVINKQNNNYDSTVRRAVNKCNETFEICFESNFIRDCN